MDINHEEKIIRSFIEKRLQDRVLFELSKQKYREKLYWRLTNYFETTVNQRYIQKMEFIDITKLVPLLKSEGATNDCYVLSYDQDYDGKYYSLNDDVIKKLICNGMPFIISCIPGKLAYFQGERELGEPVRYLFKK
ncbi:hypothetical protein [Niallia taxi]|uniref:hypothetical protein n=1 Tax=Niallia taxi TaxID=2499688 RepID=UPI002E1B586A|nr:hypothetical protein [Niallia taxi]